MWVIGPRRKLGGTRIFFFAPLLWDSTLSSFRVKVFLTLTLGSRDRFPPGVLPLNPLSSRGPGILSQYPGP